MTLKYSVSHQPKFIAFVANFTQSADDKYFYLESLLPFHSQQVELPLQINRLVQNFSGKKFSSKQNVHSKIGDMMKKFDIYEVQTILSSGRSLAI